MSGERADIAGSVSIPGRDAEGLVRLIEAAPGVRRRYQFFVWMQSHVHQLLPHAMVVCGAYRRQQRELSYEAFQGIVLPQATLRPFAGPASPLMVRIARDWVGNGGAPLVVPLSAPPAGDDALAVWQGLRQAGLGHLLVHGVTRPDRPNEIESLFVFADAGAQPAPLRTYYLELLMPHLHSVYLRVQANEREFGAMPAAASARSAAPAVPLAPARITQRECEILRWVRQGKSNQQIAAELGISPLTVKNHVQKILRKMGASNRAQAVSMAITANLLTERGHEVPR